MRPDEKVIHVQGHGEVEVVPDVALIDLGVLHRESIAREAMDRSSNVMRAIIAAVREHGVSDDDLQTAQLSLNLDRESDVYVAFQQITVRTSDLEMAGVIFAAGVACGATASSGISFSLSDPAQHTDRAVALAVTDARRKAESAARAAGLQIDGIDRIDITRGGAAQAQAHRLMRSVAGVQPPVPTQSGHVHLTAEVHVVYRFH